MRDKPDNKPSQTPNCAEGIDATIIDQEIQDIKHVTATIVNGKQMNPKIDKTMNCDNI